MIKFSYSGSELEIFAHARNWKSYWYSFIKEHIKGDVLEVGSGTGNNTKVLHTDDCSSWVCLEPDDQMVDYMQKRVMETGEYRNLSVIHGDISALKGEHLFDTILYIDVLEHIEDDRTELLKAAAHLKAGGKLIVLSPAHPRLYSEFDRQIGHFRRYTKQTILEIVPLALSTDILIYLDSFGLLASVANRLLLRQGNPTLKQIRTWDRYMIPVSRSLDRLTGYNVGKTILAVFSLKDSGA